MSEAIRDHLPLCLALFVIYGRNHLKWRKA